MKNPFNPLTVIFFIVTIVLAVLLYQAYNKECNPCKNRTNPPPMETLSLKTAAKATKHFREVCESAKIGNPIKAFMVRGVDLMQALDLGCMLPKDAAAAAAFTDTTAVRMYLGLDSLNNFKLFVVDVDGASFSKSIPGKDRFFNTKTSAKTLTSSNSGVLDFNTPCPNTCDQSSILNN